MNVRIILSRKGFDSGFGGYPSPILPDGRLISLPIPSNDKVKYSDLKLDAKKSYFDLMCALKPRIKSGKKWHELTKNTECHLDPDIYTNIKLRKPNWNACFGQVSGSQTHLRKNGVKEGDLFLFFGWFKQTILKNGKFCFKSKLAPDLQIIFGYLQIGEIIPINNLSEYPKWMQDHPHIKMKSKYVDKKETNTIYVARNHLSWDESKPGAGCFNYNTSLVLTKDGCTRSRWNLPEFFRNVKVTHHNNKSWKPEGYFQSASIGQEFIIENNKDVENWAKSLIKQSF